MHRTLIAGAPRVGKTTLAKRLAAASGLRARGTDELIARGFSFEQGPAEVLSWIEAPGHCVIEGVHVVRALRLWLASHDDGLPFDRLFWSDTAKVTRTKGQEWCAKGVNTVFSEIRSSLLERGAIVQRF